MRNLETIMDVRFFTKGHSELVSESNPFEIERLADAEINSAWQYLGFKIATSFLDDCLI